MNNERPQNFQLASISSISIRPTEREFTELIELLFDSKTGMELILSVSKPEVVGVIMDLVDSEKARELVLYMSIYQRYMISVLKKLSFERSLTVFTKDARIGKSFGKPHDTISVINTMAVKIGQYAPLPLKNRGTVFIDNVNACTEMLSNLSEAFPALVQDWNFIHKYIEHHRSEVDKIVNTVLICLKVILRRLDDTDWNVLKRSLPPGTRNKLEKYQKNCFLMSNSTLQAVVNRATSGTMNLSTIMETSNETSRAIYNEEIISFVSEEE